MPEPRIFPLTSAQVALLLFGQELYQEYCRWQETINNEDQLQYHDSAATWTLIRTLVNSSRGQFPKTSVYKAFMKCLRLQGKLYHAHDEPPPTSLVIANKCRHTIHPGIPVTNVEVCPVCGIEQCVDALRRIWNVRLILGGPRRLASLQNQHCYSVVKEIWRFEKTQWANFVLKYRDLSQLEEAWEDSKMCSASYTFDELNNARSCRAALQIAWSKHPYKLDGYDAAFMPRPLSVVLASGPIALEAPSLTGSPKPGSTLSTEASMPHPSQSLSSSPLQSSVSTRRVRLADDVQDYEYRPVKAFRRRSRAYRPGRHACSSPEGWKDTSFKNKRKYLKPGIGENQITSSDESINQSAYQRLLAQFGVRAEKGVDGNPHLDPSYGGRTSSANILNSIEMADGESDGIGPCMDRLSMAASIEKEENLDFFCDDSDSDTEPDKFDVEMGETMRTPNVGALADSSARLPGLMDRMRSLEREEPPSSRDDHQILGRRGRNSFEAELTGSINRREVKRQRRGSI